MSLVSKTPYRMVKAELDELLDKCFIRSNVSPFNLLVGETLGNKLSYVLLHSIPPISLLQVMIHLGAPWVYCMLRVMRFSNISLFTLSSLGTQILSWNLSNPLSKILNFGSTPLCTSSKIFMLCLSDMLNESWLDPHIT